MSISKLFTRGYQDRVSPESEVIKLDAQQEAIVRSTSPNIMVVAGAGSGKTRVITERVKHLLNIGVSPQNIVAITFTNLAAEEMKERLRDVEHIGDTFIGTIHSFANKIMQFSGETYKLYNDDLDSVYHKELIQKYCKFLTFDRYLEYKDLVSAVEIGKANESEVQGFFSPSERTEFNMLRRKAEEIEREIERFGSTDYAESIDTKCKQDNVITFNELLIKADTYFRSINATVEHLLVDEFQDVGSLEFQFISGLSAENNFFVGDDYQCQPRGTKVLMEDSSLKNIEDIQVGDRVVSYNLKEGRYYKKSKRGCGKKVLKISSHKSEDIVTILTEKGKESSYTKNHRCLARIHLDGNENKSVTYIMRNSKGYYRVGSTQLFVLHDRNFGVRARMNAEKAECAWILDVFDTPQEAWLAEQICAYKFGIPQTTWVTSNALTSGKELDKLYSHLSDLTDKVSHCLKMYGKDILYPIFTAHSGTHFSKIHVTEIRACNLIPKVMDVAVPYLDNENRYKNDYEQVTNLKVTESSVLEVFGLKVEDTETYVADGILTHNSIYGFKGGNVSLFLRLVEDSDFDTYYLTNNYRNSREILNLADTVISQVSRKITKSISPKIDKDGDVTIMSRNKIREALSQIDDYRNWFVLTRTNKELFQIAEMCQDLRIPFVTFKREGLTLADLRRNMNSNRVKILTVHTSKGLEADNVILYGRFPIRCPVYMNDEEERKVMYVGVTRAKDKLIVLN